MLATKAKEEVSIGKGTEVDTVVPTSESCATPEMHQEAFMQSRDSLVSSLDATDAILTELREFNRAQWVLRYPTTDSQSSPLSVLRLELKLGAAGNASTLVDSLEKSSVGQLLDERMSRSLGHLRNLRVRISDTQSKVLVTGDLNAGKSTFVNALMRRKMVPTDQQPCTMVFCEMHDATRENEGREEVHIVYDAQKYDAADPTTYTRRDLGDLEAIFEEEDNKEVGDAPVLKCYCTDVQASEESLLHNGAVDIALIDGPGLNRDSVQTTALFAREEEIDVVVFVVSAENHFTLSACEFLQNASNDKAYVFVVVNKYDQIKNKDKCRKRVLDQIRELSPRTYEEAEELVHFVDSRAMCEATEGAHDATAQAERFESLETNLRDFVLRRRAKSKLLPAQTFLERALGDILFLAQLNMKAANDDVESARAQLAKSRPALAECEANALKAQRMVESEEDRVVGQVAEHTEAHVASALDKVGHGLSAHESVPLPAYPGLWNVWEYAQDVRNALLTSVEAAVEECEESARKTTTAAVNQIGAAGSEHLPSDVKVPQRVFMPEAMFAKKSSTHFAGLGVSVDIVAVRISDLFDVQHHLSFLTAPREGKSEKEETSLVPSMSIGLGALTLVGSRSLGIKTAIEAFVRLTDILGSRAARRWAAPVLLLVSAGALTWVIMDLPNAVPRNVGRSLQQELMSGEVVRAAGNSTALLRNSSNVFATMHSSRVTRETRKVLRLASWDLQEKFRVAIGHRRSDVERAEQQEKVAAFALKWFTETSEKSSALSDQVMKAIDVAAL